MSLVERVFVIKVQFLPSTAFSTFVVSSLMSFLFVDRNSEGPLQLPHYGRTCTDFQFRQVESKLKSPPFLV